MVEKQRCPRCGRVVENGFCPHCDLEATERGVIRRHKKTKNKKAKSALEFTIEKANIAKQNQEDIFAKRDEGAEDFQKDLTFTQITDYQNQTVADALAQRDAQSLAPVFNREVEVDEIATRLTGEEVLVEHDLKEDDIVPLPFSLNKAEEVNEEPEINFVPKETILVKEENTKEENTKEENTKEENTAIEVQSQEVQNEQVEVLEEETEGSNSKTEARAEGNGPFELGINWQGIKDGVKKYRFWILGAIVLVIVMCVLININNNYNAKVAAEKQIESNINSFYVNNDAKKGYLAKTVDDKSLQTVEKEISNLSKTNKAKADTYQKQIDNMKRDQDLVNKINELYLSPKIQGSQVLNPALKEDTEVNLTEIKNPQNDLEKAINSSIADAKSQKDQQEKAKNAVEKVYSNNQVVTTATKQDYLDAKKEVDAVKNINFKKKYSEAIRQAGIYFGNE